MQHTHPNQKDSVDGYFFFCCSAVAFLRNHIHCSYVVVASAASRIYLIALAISINPRYIIIIIDKNKKEIKNGGSSNSNGKRSLRIHASSVAKSTKYMTRHVCVCELCLVCKNATSYKFSVSSMFHDIFIIIINIQSHTHTQLLTAETCSMRAKTPQCSCSESVFFFSSLFSCIEFCPYHESILGAGSSLPSSHRMKYKYIFIMYVYTPHHLPSIGPFSRLTSFFPHIYYLFHSWDVFALYIYLLLLSICITIFCFHALPS